MATEDVVEFRKGREVLPGTNMPGGGTLPAQGPPSTLPNEVREAVLAHGCPAFDRKRNVASLVTEHFEASGFFCRTNDGRLYYFSRQEKRLYEMDSREFGFLLSSVSGLNPIENFFKFTLSSLQTRAARTRPVEVHSIAHYDRMSGRLAVSDSGTGVWLREPRGGWRSCDNGDHGLLFATDQDGERFEPDLESCGVLGWYLSQFLFSDHNSLTRDDYATLFLTRLLSEFFPGLRRTRVLPAFLGPQGSGKTSAMRLVGRLIVGPGFDVTNLLADKEDGFVAAITNRVVVGFDNADSRVKWLEDQLATYSTGQKYSLRRLYSTNELLSFEPRAFGMISSRDPHFRRPDVAERLLPLHFERPKAYLAESQLADELHARRDSIWGELLVRLADIQDSLPETNAPRLTFRMADFASFGWRVAKAAGREGEWMKLLDRLEGSQMEFAGEGDGLVEALRLLLADKGEIGPATSGELFKACSEVAAREGLAFPRSVQSFGMRLSNMRRVIEVELKAKLTEERTHQRKRVVRITRVSDTGDAGDANSASS